YAKAANVARGEFLVFLDAEASVTPGWLTPMLKTFEDIAGVGVVCPALLGHDGLLQQPAPPRTADAGQWFNEINLDPDHPRNRFAHEVETCSSACMMIPKHLFSQAELSERHDAAREDIGFALAREVRRNGHKIICQPMARIVVRSIRSNRAAPAKQIRLSHQLTPPHIRIAQSEHHDSSSGPPNVALRHSSNPRHERRRILVIDQYLPTPDQDAGSLRMVGILKAIRVQGHHVALMPASLTPSTPAASFVQSLGVEALYQPYYSSVREYLEKHGREFDLVILSRADVAVLYIESVKSLAPQAKVVFDTVDLQFVREARGAELMRDPVLRLSARRRKR